MVAAIIITPIGDVGSIDAIRRLWPADFFMLVANVNIRAIDFN
jgi:hypothetical protein